MDSSELFLVGLSHQSAPVTVRERVACSGDGLRSALEQLRNADGVAEAMVLSTCNRVEVYIVARSPDPARRLFDDLAADVAPHLYERRGSDAARHLFRVAASLDSMVVGEPQILGQVKEAYGIASALQVAGPVMSRLCNRVFAAAKRVRNETDIARGAGSVSQVAVELVEELFGGVRGRTVLLAGAGKMGTLAAKALSRLGAGQILVVNRSSEAGEALARRVGGRTIAWERLFDALSSADVVLVSTGAQGYVVTRDLAARAVESRSRRPMCLIDLAVPRNVDPTCGELEDVHVYDMDDLQRVVRATQTARAEEAVRAEAIVDRELCAFTRDHRTRAALPVLIALRRRALEIARAEADRALVQLGDKLDEKGKKSVEAMARAIVNKLMHAPTERLKQAAACGDSSLPDLAAELFGLEQDS